MEINILTTTFKKITYFLAFILTNYAAVFMIGEGFIGIRRKKLVLLRRGYGKVTLFGKKAILLGLLNIVLGIVIQTFLNIFFLKLYVPNFCQFFS